MTYSRPLIISFMVCLLGCADRQPLATVDYVDIEKFMGDWYVVANIPTMFEKNAHNPIESYRLNPDGSIATTFTFNSGSFEGEEKVMTATGFIKNKYTNAEWGMQFIWPIKADYRIVDLEQDYQYTVVGRNKQDYVWIMARQSQMPDEVYNKLRTMLVTMGYNIQQIQRAPHRYTPQQ